MILLVLLNILIGNNDTLLLKETEKSGFNNAVSITSSGNGYIYVLDNESCEIIKLDGDMKEVKRSGRKGWDNGEFDNPRYIDCSSGLDLYVSDYNNSRVQRFDLNLGFISSLNTNSEIIEDKYKINRPSASIILNTQDLYVLDRDNQKVVFFSKGVSPAFYFGSYQSLDGALIKPVKILKDSRNNIYIFDEVKGVLKFNNFGTFIGNITPDSIKAMSMYNNVLYMLSGTKIYSYDCEAGAYSGTLGIEMKKQKITDFLIYNSQRIFFLEKEKLISYSITKK